MLTSLKALTRPSSALRSGALSRLTVIRVSVTGFDSFRVTPSIASLTVLLRLLIAMPFTVS